MYSEWALKRAYHTSGPLNELSMHARWGQTAAIFLTRFMHISNCHQAYFVETPSPCVTRKLIAITMHSAAESKWLAVWCYWETVMLLEKGLHQFDDTANIDFFAMSYAQLHNSYMNPRIKICSGLYTPDMISESYPGVYCYWFLLVKFSVHILLSQAWI